jgi:hypothetical protein
MNLPGTAIDNIIEYSDINTLYTIAALRLGRPLRSIITYKIKNELAIRLKENFNTRSSHLYDKLERVGLEYPDVKAVAIAGSAMVGALLGTTYYKSDIDVYVAGGAVNRVRHVLYSEGFVLVNSGIDIDL